MYSVYITTNFFGLEEVKIAFKTTGSKDLPIKVKISLLFTKYGMSFFLYTSCGF